MTAQADAYYTPEQYLEMERRAAFKSEYINGKIYPLGEFAGMAGASPAHNIIASNLVGALWSRLRGRGRHVFGSDMRVRVSATGLRAYPDVSALCGKLDLDSQENDSLRNPSVLVEVLSPSTEGFDRGEKFAHYRRLESLTDYVLISQDAMLVEHYVRQPDDGWVLREFSRPEQSIPLASLQVELPLSEIYEQVPWPPAPPSFVIST